MRKGLGLAVLLLAVGWPVVAEDIYGFGQGRIAEHVALEARYAAELNAGNLDAWMREMTMRPHHAGSPKAKENAAFMASLLSEWGFDTEIETYHVLFPTPTKRVLTLLEPERFEASLTEEIFGRGPVAEAIRAEGLPPFNAFSGEGEVTADLVYVNQGLPRDYEVLARRGVSVAGKIVIARYGGSWRGIKPKVAAEHGAIGCIIYNDPKADGYTQGDGYPEGGFKHDTAVQRGSVMDLPMRPGDPLTPYKGSTKHAERLLPGEAETIMQIPVLPISRADAEPFLRSLRGDVVPESWRGALPITYRFGGDGTVRVHLQLEFNWDLVPAHNVIARMEGDEYPDEWVIRGNHHDAWVVGARDPISGIVAMLEQARAFGELAKDGWRPKRTLVFCAWDAEEPALLGSTEWVEHHAKELREKAVAYINTDGNSRGFLSIGGSHALETLAAQVGHAVIDPETGVTISERLRAQRLLHGDAEAKKRAKGSEDLWLYPLGSGSDYSAFLQHLGIASFNVSFRGHGRAGEYHTAFDTYDHYMRFVDPTLVYGRALADVCGRLTLRLSEADVLPFDFERTAATLRTYVDDVVALADTKREEVEQFNEAVEKDYFALTADRSERHVPPEAKPTVPHLNFAPLQNAMDRVQAAAGSYKAARSVALESLSDSDARTLAKLNRLLYQSERAFIDSDGLPRRPWFRHRIYAPGFYTGYGVKTLPGVREAIEEELYEEARVQIEKTADALNRFADQIERANRLVEGMGQEEQSE